MKLAVIPDQSSVAIATFDTVQQVAFTAGKMVRAGIPLAALEKMDEKEMEFINANGGAGGRLWEERPTLFIKCVSVPRKRQYVEELTIRGKVVRQSQRNRGTHSPDREHRKGKW